jgi:hypothetical protein
MNARVAVGAQSDQILFLVTTRLATQFDMVYLQILHAPAELASPGVAFQYVLVKFAIALRIKSELRALAADLLHEAVWLTSDRKISCCGLGSNP